MHNNFIDGEKLYYGFSTGKTFVLANKSKLNKINVFPVADGDTGSNLAYTLHSITQGSSANKSAAKVIQDMANAALIGSRGNSGIIFAQFIQGLYHGTNNKNELSKTDFANAVKHGSNYAYKSVAHPVEGTILTIINAWAESLLSLHEKTHNFTEFISNSINSIKKALSETPKKLKVLKDAGVVDAGAQGFVHFVEGFLHFLQSGLKPAISDNENILISESNIHHFDKSQIIENRYCTEGLLHNSNFSIDEIKNTISEYGNSLIVASSHNKIKFHVHTNYPWDLFNKLSKDCVIAETKVDDMQRQFEMQFNRKSSIAVVTDSTCDLPQEILDKYQINVVPVNLIIGENNYLDKFTIKPEQFYKLIDSIKVKPQTSQPSVKAFEKTYESLLENYDAVISIHISHKLSGTYNAAKLASEKFSDKKIAVIDSKHISSSLGLIVQQIAQEVFNEKSFDEIVHYANSLIQKTKILVSVKNLKYMIRSGRVSPLKGYFAKLLNLKPIISLNKDGASSLSGKAFGFEKNNNNIIEELKKIDRQNKIYKFAIGHSNSETIAQEFSRAIERELGLKAEFIMEIAPVIGAHAGVGALSVSFIHQ